MEKNRYTIFDSSVWIAFYKNADTQHKKSVTEIKKWESTNKQCLVSNLIVEEVFSVLTYIGHKKYANQFINFCINNKRITWLDLDKNFIDKINTFSNHDFLKNKKISFTDFSIIFLAKHFDFEILSFDKELNKTAKKISNA